MTVEDEIRSASKAFYTALNRMLARRTLDLPVPRPERQTACEPRRQSIASGLLP